MTHPTHDITTPGLISDIETWACAIAGTERPTDPGARALIVNWSRFTGSQGDDVTIGNKPLGAISHGWLAQIHRKARTAYAQHKAAPTYDMFEGKPTKSTSGAEVHLPRTEGYDNGSDLPF